MKDYIKRRPATAYFLLTFVLSWSGIVLASFFMGMPTTSTQFEQDGPLALMPLLLGPTIIGLALTGIVHGRAGFRDLKSRFTNWRVGIGWYAVTLLALPAVLLVILLILGLFSPDFTPKVLNETDKVSFIITGIIMGFIGGGILEEIGWTGFATPALRKRFGVFGTGLILGLIWAAWHFLPVLWGSGDARGDLDWSLFLPGLFCHYTVLVSYRILMVWVHEKTQSIIPVSLMHGVLGAFLNFILNISVGGWPLFIYYLILALVLWIVVALVFRREKSLVEGGEQTATA